MKLFKSKRQKIKEACKDIHFIIKDSQEIINDTQVLLSKIQENIQEMISSTKELQVLKEKEVNYYDEILEHLNKLEGDKS